MNAALYTGRIWHQRLLPHAHAFSYHFFMWYFDLDQLQVLPERWPLFAVKRPALCRLYRPDYYGDPRQPLHQAIKSRMRELTGVPVAGRVTGLLNLRTLGLYFSPVNFYFGYDAQDSCSHFLAEVSNTPWNERHQYAHLLKEIPAQLENDKAFHVSPFNPHQQRYHWQVSPPEDTATIAIAVHDQRGHVFSARLQLRREPLTTAAIGRQLLRKPVMTAAILAGIYWQALRLYCKGLPYVPYQKEAP